MTVKELLDGVLGPYGVVTLIILIGVAGAARKWVFGWTYDALAKREDEWRELALSLLQAGHKAIEIVEEQTKEKHAQ